MSWNWTRAVWIEKGDPTEGTVPSSWIEDNNLRWPTKQTYQQAIAKRLVPSSNWDSFPIVKQKLTHVSKDLCEDYNFTTTDGEETDEEDHMPSLKKRKTTSVPLSDCTNNFNNPFASIEKDVPIVNFTSSKSKSANVILPVTTEMPMPMLSDFNNTFADRGKPPNNQPTASTPISTGSFPWATARYQERSIFLLTEIRQLLRKVVTKLESLEGGSFQNPTVETGFNEFKETFLQLESLVELEEVETKLKNKDYKKYMIKFLSTCGGKNSDEATKSIYRRLMSNTLLSSLNLCGRGGKTGIVDTEIYKLIEDIVVTNQKSDAKTVRDSVSRMLKAAPDRPGGSGRTK